MFGHDTASESNPAIARGVAVIRARRRCWWFVFLSYMPGVFLVGDLLSSLTRWEDARFLVAAAWMAAFLVVGVVVTLSRCPRCGELFHIGHGWHNPWAQRCRNCALPLHGSRPATSYEVSFVNPASKSE